MNPKMRLPATALALVGPVAGCGTSSPAPTSTGSNTTQSSNSSWLSSNASTKTVNLNLEAAYQNVNGGMSFDGFANGDMTVTVPKGWNVQVSFSNDSSMPHSAMIVPYDDHQEYELSTSLAAFHGAFTSHPQSGSLKGTKQNFSFTANKAGQYAIVCAVPGHAAAGMWDTFVVSDTATQATLSTK